MPQLLFGLALISASLQTAWAVLAEGQYPALAIAVVVLMFGAKCIVDGVLRRRLYRA